MIFLANKSVRPSLFTIDERRLARGDFDAGASLRSDVSLSRRGRKRQADFRRMLREQRYYVTTDNIAYGTYTAMTVTNLQSLAIDTTDPFAGWQSARVDNQTTTKADDYEVQILLSTAATAPANDSAIYVYVVPWMYDGSTWTPAANFGTTTRPTGTEGTASMSEPNSMKVISFPYKITSQPIDGFFTIRGMCGEVPDGWSLALRNNCGSALGTGCVVAYRPITFTNT